MKIKIEYDYWGDDCRAFTIVDGWAEVALSQISFEDAKEKLLKKVAKHIKREIPETEEVEI